MGESSREGAQTVGGVVGGDEGGGGGRVGAEVTLGGEIELIFLVNYNWPSSNAYI